jgi:hypothetical protein
MAAPFIDHPLMPDAAVIHVVRNPLAVISSLVLDMHLFCDGEGYFDEFRRFALAHMPDVMHLPTEIERACMYWVQWNEMIVLKSLGRRYLRCRAEEVLSDELRGFLKAPADRVREAFSNSAINSWKTRPADLALADIPRGPVRDRFLCLAALTGYPNLR